MEKLLIRDFKIDDFIGINILMNEVQKLHVENRPDCYKSAEEIISKGEFINNINDDKTIAILAEIDFNIVGLCIISIKHTPKNKLIIPRTTAYMEALCVHKAYRKKGIGKKLFDEGKKRALEFNIESLELMVWEFNEDSIRFYENENMKIRSRIMELKI